MARGVLHHGDHALWASPQQPRRLPACFACSDEFAACMHSARPKDSLVDMEVVNGARCGVAGSRSVAYMCTATIPRRHVQVDLQPGHATQSEHHSQRAVVRAAAASATDLASDLRQLEPQLAKDGPDADNEAVGMVQSLKDAGKLKAFGTGRQVPKQLYSLEDLRMNKIQPEALLAPTDDTLGKIRTGLQIAALAGLAAATYALHLEVQQILLLTFGAITFSVADQVANRGGLEALALDAVTRAVSPSYGERVAAHEAAHFLVAYLLGLLPKRYTLSSLDAFQRYRALNVQAGTQFCDASFQSEVASGKLSSSSLDVYSCVALAGVCQEYITHGRSEGGLNDVQQLDSLLRALRFSQNKADGQIRWAVLNTISVLRRHKVVHGQLAEAMAAGQSVSCCISLVEAGLRDSDDI